MEPLHHKSGILLLGLLLAAILTRVLLFTEFPVFIVNDSGDYIWLAERIFHDLDFSDLRLGDIRLPVYPVFLAITHLAGFSSDNIVLGQKILGVVCILVGLWIGYLLDSRLIQLVLVFYLGFNPVYLLNEHLVMTEGLFLLTLLVFSAVALLCLRGRINIATGAALGVAIGLCVLTRTNGLFFCLTIIAGIVLLQIARRGRALVNDKRNKLYFLTGLVAGALLIFGPWLLRNYRLLGTPTISNFNARNLLAYQAAHYLFDPTLPLASEFREYFDPQYPSTIYALIFHLGAERNPVETESLAWALVREQFLDKPREHFQAVLRAFLRFGGYPPPHPVPGFARGELHYWFQNIVSNMTFLHSLNQSYHWYDLVDFTYIPHGKDTQLTQAWSRAGVLYLDVICPLLFDLFLIFLVVYLAFRRKAVKGIKDSAIILFGLAYLATILFHSITLSDSDRYTTPFDWIPIMIIALVAVGLIEPVFRKKAGPKREGIL